ncbi:pyridoxal phosphate-dependent transferase [Aspergillus californicus]
MDHSAQVKKYFQLRTKDHNGIMKDIMYTSEKEHSIIVCDNDYLNLVHHKDVVTKQANDLLDSSVARDTIKSSIFISEFDPHTALEKDIAAWYGKDCYLAQSGYAANVGVMHAICTPGMNVYIDRFLHASFYDGLAARKVKVHVFLPNNAADLEKKIQENGPGLILIESVYSTSGSFAPLEEIVTIKKKHNCLIVVDESHSLGLYGSEGRGLLYDKGLVSDVEYVTASLAKAFATRAGIVFTNHTTYAKENAFPFIFSSGLVQNDIVRIRAIWEVIKPADDRRARLMRISAFLREELSKFRGIQVVNSESAPCPIIGVFVGGDEETLVRFHRFLSKKGILAAPFIAPATSKKFPVLRFSLHCDITIEQGAAIVRAFKDWRFFGCKL